MSSIGKYRLALSGAIILSVLAHLVILWNSIPHIASGHGDFGIFYTGAQILHAGRGAELYDPNVQQAYQEKFLAPSTEWNLPFNHAPYELLIFLPLVYFSYPIAFLIWGLFNLLLLALACRHLISFIHPDHRLLLGAFLFASYPTMVTLQMGQDSILTLCILVGVFANLKRHNDFMAGCLLAFGLYKPQLIIPMVGLLFVEKRWRGAIGFAITLVFLLGISLAMIGFRAALDYLPLLQYHDYVLYPYSMTNIRGLLYIASKPYVSAGEAALLSIGASILLYIGCLYLCRLKTGQKNSFLDLRFSLFCVTAILVSYHLYAHDLLLLILASVLMLNYVLEGHVRSAVIRFSLLSIILFFSIPMLPVLISADRQLASATVLVLLYYMTIGLELSLSKSAGAPERVS